MRALALVVAAAALALGSCSGGSEPAGPPAPGPVALGIWGSDEANGANLTVEAAGATLETSCSSGSVPVALVAGSDGSFEASGTYGRIGGAPPPDGVWPRDAAVFRGIVAGGTMTLTVRVAGAAADLGPFVLTHGHRGQIIYCP